MIVIYQGGELHHRYGEVCRVVKSIEEGGGLLYTLLFKNGITHKCVKEYTKEVPFTKYYEEINNRSSI